MRDIEERDAKLAQALDALGPEGLRNLDTKLHVFSESTRRQAREFSYSLSSIQKCLATSQYCRSFNITTREGTALLLPMIIMCHGFKQNELIPVLLLPFLAVRLGLNAYLINKIRENVEDTIAKIFRMTSKFILTMMFTFQIIATSIALYFLEKDENPQKSVNDAILAILLPISFLVALLRIGVDLRWSGLDARCPTMFMRGYGTSVALQPFMEFIIKPIVDATKLVSEKSAIYWAFGTAALVSFIAGSVISCYQNPKLVKNLWFYDGLEAACATANICTWLAVLSIFPNIGVGLVAVLGFHFVEPLIASGLASLIKYCGKSQAAAMETLRAPLVSNDNSSFPKTPIMGSYPSTPITIFHPRRPSQDATSAGGTPARLIMSTP